MYPYFFDWTYLLLIPAMILSLYAQYMVRSTYSRYSRRTSGSGMTGASMAKMLLQKNGLGNVAVDRVAGEMTDHYDPRDKSLHLSDGVYASDSVAALSIVAHEVGHAVQDAKSYFPLKFRSVLVPVSNWGSTLSIPLFFAGILMSYGPLMDLGIIMFSLAVAFTVITLPVEFNASTRAMVMLNGTGSLAKDELGMARQMLTAAALTYVANTAMSVMQLIRLVVLRNSRND